jgi:hypothetical protein
MHLYMIVEPMTPYPARGYSRLPVSRGGSVHTPGRKRDAMPRTTLMTTSQLARFIAVSAGHRRARYGTRSVVDVCQKGGADAA